MGAAASAALSLLFILVYGACNWITAQRTDVGTWYYDWERYIPFEPVMILPYMSIDLFYVAAPFLCSSRGELRVLVRRIAAAILISGTVFLIIPLRLGAMPPEPTSWTGPLFRLLHGFDQPTNLFPSLHIALRTILADLYARHAKGAVRLTSHVWFSLIGFSTLLTYQHHFVDIVGGFVVPAICFYMFREDLPRVDAPRNSRIAIYYGSGAVVAAVLAMAKWPWTGILIWPALSMIIVMAGYLGLGPSIYRSCNWCL